LDVELMEELARHGYDVGAETRYPMLHQLEIISPDDLITAVTNAEA
jgi:hypothetical protein